MSGGRMSAYLKKTAYYLKRNGIKNTYYAISERLAERRQPLYRFVPPQEEELARQRAAAGEWEYAPLISVVVPCYRTPETFLREMVDSVRGQSYERWELILTDASEDDCVEKAIRPLGDPRIRYVKLERNGGIAENTNRGILLASGEYIGLLDHDDLLTRDALYRMAETIRARQKSGRETWLLYSDEDKCAGDGNTFYEPNRKEDFNLDLFLSNNYICHFMALKSGLIRKLRMRGEYEGAQDYDLALRAVAALEGKEDGIVHLPRVLYHWRCHLSSTAQNPQSKLYAYEAGRRALQDFAAQKGWTGEVRDTAHLGFYRLEYSRDIFEIRQDLGATGGPVFEKGRIAGGRMTAQGEVFYRGLKKHYGGYLHRAHLCQDAQALDIRNIRIRREARELFREITGVAWRTAPGRDIFDIAALPQDADLQQISLALSEGLREAGYRLLYLPEQERTSGT